MSDEKPDHWYIRCVTLGEFLRHFTGLSVVWIVMSVISVVVGLLFEAAATTVEKTFLDTIPKTVWFWVAVAVFTWVCRGKTFKMPRWSFGAWVLLNVWCGCVILVGTFLPWWVDSPLVWAAIVMAAAYERLVEMGKANYSRISSQEAMKIDVS
jgi:hypothetical protein